MTQRAPAPALLSAVGFDSQPRTRLVFGAGCVDQVGRLAQELGARRILLVTDPGIVKAGHAEKVQRLLEAQGISVTRFQDVEENPSTACVTKCFSAAKAAMIDTIVGLGGGSSMDTAKGTNFLLTNGGRMQDYWGIGKARHPMLPLIAIPTTGGTGSECQSFALITDEVTHQKMACGDAKAAARVAILDPLLTVSQPPRVTACTGIDAIAHAVETAVTNKRTELSRAFSREAFRLGIRALPNILAQPGDIGGRGRMLLAAAWSGTAIENSMLGAAHAAANPLTARFGVVHGHAVGIMLPHVVRFNAHAPDSAQSYAELATLAELPDAGANPAHAAQQLASHLDQLLVSAKLPGNLSSLGVSPADIPILSEEASKQWTVQFNPRSVTTADFSRMYSDALAG